MAGDEITYALRRVWPRTDRCRLPRPGPGVPAEPSVRASSRSRQEVLATGSLNQASSLVLRVFHRSQSPTAGARAERLGSSSSRTGWLPSSSGAGPPRSTRRSRDGRGEAPAGCEVRRRTLRISALAQLGRSILAADLNTMRLRVTHQAPAPDLADALPRFPPVLRSGLATYIYTGFATSDSQIYRFIVPSVPPPHARRHCCRLEFACPQVGPTSAVGGLGGVHH